MLSYKYFITRILNYYGGYALKNLLQGVISARDTEQLKSLARNGRVGFDQLKYWTQKHRSVQALAPIKVQGVRIYQYVPDASKPNEEPVIYFHGGGFIVGSNNSHGALASELSHAMQRTVFLVEYPKFPEVRLQEMISACCDVIEGILQNMECRSYLLFGDSAGGFLACQAVVRRIQAKKLLPKCVMLLSPVIQHKFEYDDQAYLNTAKTDAILGRVYEYIVKNREESHIATSRLGCDEVVQILDMDPKILAKFPSMHITYASDEVLFSEISAFIDKLQSLNVRVVDNSVDNVVHAFAIYSYLRPSKSYFRTIKSFFNTDKMKDKG